MDTVRFYRGQEDVVVVEKKDFGQSIFREQYVLALQQLEKMVDNPKGGIPSIVAFCGDRGEGKTSCMESIIHMLKNKQHETVTTFWGNQYPHLAESKFEVLETIDPAFFDENHNVLELVLGQLYTKYEQKKDKLIEEARELVQRKAIKENGQKLQTCFHDAKWCLTQMIKKQQSGYDPIEELDSLSAGMSLRDRVSELIDEYLKIMVRGYEEDKTFLVISIDDLDLNVGEAYVMAEQIRKYLVGKHCVILMSLKIEQLIEVIANYLDRQTAPDKSLDTPAMAAKYLTKLIPMSNRVMMPKVYDLCDKSLSVFKNEHDNHPKVFNSIKEAVVQLIYQKTRYLFYNSKGSVSPIVPNNLRSLRHLLGMLLNMRNFEGNEASMANKNSFKSYFYQTWVRQMNDKSQRVAHLLVNDNNVNDVNKLVVSELAQNIDKDQASELVKDIINPNNYSYNISIGDVFHLINFLERSNVDEELKLLLFFIKSFYSIRLYEYYDVITEQSGEMFPEPTDMGEVYRSDGWFKRTNQLQRLVNGSYFTYQPDDLLPLSKVNGEDFYRDLRVYSAITPFYKDNIKTLYSDITAFEIMEDEEEREVVKRRFRVAEFLAFTTKKAIKQKEAARYVNVKRDFAEPFYLTDYNRYTGYLLFDIMAPFYNIVNIKYTYGRFSYMRANDANPTDFYQFALTHDWSLLRRMIDYVRLKEHNEQHPDQLYRTTEELPALQEDEIDKNFMRLVSNASIRNGDVLLAMMENITSRRANMHNIRDHIDCLKEFYKDIINSEMRTYRNQTTDAPYIIRFAFLEAMIELMENREERDILLKIYERGIGTHKADVSNVYDAFPKFFGTFKTKKNTAISSDMHKLYPDAAARITESKWKELFPIDKSYKREEIAEILAKVLNEMVGVEDDEDDDEF